MRSATRGADPAAATSLNQPPIPTPRRTITQNTTRCKEKVRLTPLGKSGTPCGQDLISDMDEVSVRLPSEFQNRENKQHQIKLKTLEEFCKEENVFFDEKDRVRYNINKSVSLFNQYRECMQKSFEHVQVREEVPNLRTMMMTQKEFQESAKVQEAIKNYGDEFNKNVFSTLSNADNRRGSNATPRFNSTGRNEPSTRTISGQKAQQYGELTQRSREQEFSKLSNLLHTEYELKPQPIKKRRQSKNPCTKLSNALQHYKKERVGTEDQLIKRIQKVNLDKRILFREKQGILWQENGHTAQSEMEDALRKEK